MLTCGGRRFMVSRMHEPFWLEKAEPMRIREILETT
jgi:hypothetical protein